MAETIYKKEEKPEVDRFVGLIKKMNDSEKSNMLIFMQGVQFAKNANKGAKRRFYATSNKEVKTV